MRPGCWRRNRHTRLRKSTLRMLPLGPGSVPTTTLSCGFRYFFAHRYARPEHGSFFLGAPFEESATVRCWRVSRMCPSIGYQSRPRMTRLLTDTTGRLGNPHNSFTTQDKARGAEPPSPANGVSVLLDVPLFPLFLVSFSSSKVEA